MEESNSGRPMMATQENTSCIGAGQCSLGRKKLLEMRAQLNTWYGDTALSFISLGPVQFLYMDAANGSAQEKDNCKLGQDPTVIGIDNIFWVY